MITKERLEELIEQQSAVYVCWGTCLIEDKKVSLEEKCEPELFVNGENDYILYVKPINKNYKIEIYCEHLFETEEETEWEIEFGNIARTETLKLPTWEEFRNKVSDYDYELTFTPPNKEMFYYMTVCGTHTLVIYHKIGFDSFIFEKEFTKENYIEACRLCKKLFLGEEITWKD